MSGLEFDILPRSPHYFTHKLTMFPVTLHASNLYEPSHRASIFFKYLLHLPACFLRIFRSMPPKEFVHCLHFSFSPYFLVQDSEEFVLLFMDQTSSSTGLKIAIYIFFRHGQFGIFTQVHCQYLDYMILSFILVQWRNFGNF